MSTQPEQVEPRFDITRQYVIVGPARAQSTLNSRATSGRSFAETLHREGCRYVTKVPAEQQYRTWMLTGLSIPDLYQYGHGVPEKVCKVCMKDWYEYLAATPPESGYSPSRRRRQDRERMEFSTAHGEWFDALPAEQRQGL